MNNYKTLVRKPRGSYRSRDASFYKPTITLVFNLQLTRNKVGLFQSLVLLQLFYAHKNIGLR